MSLDLCVSLNCSTLTEIQQDFATAISGGADLVELRLDYLKPAELDRLTELEEWFGRNADRLIVSFRPVDQGGLHDGDTATRVSTLLWAGGLRPRYIDFEYACFARSDDMRDKARLMASAGDDNRWDRLILSEHHLEQRPPTLERKFLDMCDTPAELIKLVWRARNANDNFEAFDLLHSQARRAIVCCVEADGLPSRILGKKLGCPVTYCALRRGEETAPGQPTLDEMMRLYHWKSINRETAVYGLIGDPVAHSLSPHVHNAALAACKLNAVYLPFRIENDGFAFADFIRAVADRPWLDIRGFSVTSPHKHNAFLLTEEDLDPISRRTESVNTIRFDKDNVQGWNTDYQAALDWLTQALECELPGLAERRFDVLGAGGLARSVVAGLRLIRAPVTIHNRTLDHAKVLAEAFDCQAATLNEETKLSGDVLINCTMVGMWSAADRSPVLPEQINPERVVFDAIYNPLKTKLLADAEARGCRTVGGLELFVGQAALQFTALTGYEAPRSLMHEVASEQLKP